MTLTLIVVGVIALLWLGRVAARAAVAWRIERALKRREQQIQRYVMGRLEPTRKQEP